MHAHETEIWQPSKTYLGDTPTDEQRANNGMRLNLPPSTFLPQYYCIVIKNIAKKEQVVF